MVILLNEFLHASTEIGENINLVQGAGGNTSYKQGNSLFIKASGHKLKNSLKTNMFVEVNIEQTLKQLKIYSNEPIKSACNHSINLRPSIETTMHILMPQKYVFHVHCVNTISWLVQKNFEEKILNSFDDYKFQIIQYAKPGLNLTKAIQEKMKKNNIPEILFLSNHGLVVGADSVDEVLHIINLVSNRLANQIRSIQIENKISQLSKISRNTLYKPSKYNKAHKIAFCGRSIQIACSGSMYPDHVVFLGPKILIANSNEDVLKISKEYISTKLPLIIVPTYGLLVPKDISIEAEEMVLALSLIIERIPDDKEINYLSKEEEEELINWPSEIYRVQLNQSK